MRSVVVLFLGALVAVQASVEVGGAYDYHERVGIPLAQKIKAEEDRLFNPLDGRIVGGVASPLNAEPFLAGLVIDLVNAAGMYVYSLCGASLLSRSRLVTAAHCCSSRKEQVSHFEVVLGSQFLFYGGTRIRTSQAVIHPQYGPSTSGRDIAIIYLPTELSFNAEVQPIALPSGTQMRENFVGEWAIAAGYGRTSDQQRGVPGNTSRRHVRLQVISVGQCRRIYGEARTAHIVCTRGTGGVGTCYGDSGGPLYVTRNGTTVLIGVSSFVALPGCQKGYPSGFTRITSYQSWIQQHLE